MLPRRYFRCVVGGHISSLSRYKGNCFKNSNLTAFENVVKATEKHCFLRSSENKPRTLMENGGWITPSGEAWEMLRSFRSPVPHDPRAFDCEKRLISLFVCRSHDLGKRCSKNKAGLKYIGSDETATINLNASKLLKKNLNASKPSN